MTSLKAKLAQRTPNNGRVGLARLAVVANRKDGLSVSRASDIKPEAVEWLWPGWLARGKCHLLSGMPGVGKSFVTTSLAATLTTGRKFPDGTDCPVVGDVIFLAGEDGLADTVVPRLIAHGADRSRVHFINYVRRIDEDGPHDSPVRLDVNVGDIDRMFGSMENPIAMIIDPVSQYLGRTDSHKDADVRQTLGPLAAAAEKHNVALILIAHYSKDSKRDPIYRSAGSIAFVAQCRICWCFISDPQDDGRVAVLQSKNNLGKRPDGLAYQIAEYRFDGIETARVEWSADRITSSLSELMDESRTAPKRNEATDWLKDHLADGCVAANAVYDAAEKADVSRGTLKRAKKELGVVSSRSRLTEDGTWFWSLPSADDENDSEHGDF